MGGAHLTGSTRRGGARRSVPGEDGDNPTRGRAAGEGGTAAATTTGQHGASPLSRQQSTLSTR
jgi:hypothetical protein